VAEFVYNLAKLYIADGTIVLTSGGGTAPTCFHMALVTTGYLNTAEDTLNNQDYLLTATTAQSIAHFEAATTSNYARGTLAQSSATEDDTGNLAYVDTDDQTFSSVSSGAAAADANNLGAAIVYAELAASDSSGRVPVSLYDTGFPITPNNGDITVQFSTGGWIQLTS
jgi:hypothetical protein